MSKFVIVAEDDTFLAETICLALEEHGMRVQVVGDGEQAVLAIEKEQPDLLLLDLLMPKKDGIYVLQEMHKKESTFPVVILSNLSGDMTPEKCFALGAKDYMVKSDMDEEELWPRLEKYLK